VRVLDTLPKKAEVILDFHRKTINIQSGSADDLGEEASRTTKQPRRRSRLDELHRRVRIVRRGGRR
jgi:hypothetical protein